ncbi:hypothetical protein HDR61_00870 [bacterium]|nr:hypothetical protein [bacterium]
MSKGWDNAMLKKLKALTGKGLSTAEIGKKLGMSKNAVVGKLNRLGWNSKAVGAPAEVTKKSAKTVEKTAEKIPAKTKDVAKKAAGPKKADTALKDATKKAAVPKDKRDAAPVKTTVVKKDVASKEVAAPVRETSKSMNKTLAMHQRIVQHSLEMANLKPNQCRWPIGDPDSEHFHFCGEQVFVGKPYCYEHCKQAYQFTPPKKK